MRISVLLFAATITVFSLSCKPDIKSSNNEALYTEVMAIHDEVMPKMSDIHKLRKKIRKQYTDQAASEYQEALNTLTQLEKADESMMDWMAAFKVPEEVSSEEQQHYLEAEKVKISAVREEMLTAISNAKKLVKE